MFNIWMNSPLQYPGIDLAWEAQEWDLPVVGLFQFLKADILSAIWVLCTVFLFCFVLAIYFVVFCVICCVYSMLFVLMLSGTEFFDCANGLKVMVI